MPPGDPLDLLAHLMMSGMAAGGLAAGAHILLGMSLVGSVVVGILGSTLLLVIGRL